MAFFLVLFQKRGNLYLEFIEQKEGIHKFPMGFSSHTLAVVTFIGSQLLHLFWTDDFDLRSLSFFSVEADTPLLVILSPTT